MYVVIGSDENSTSDNVYDTTLTSTSIQVHDNEVAGKASSRNQNKIEPHKRGEAF